MLLAMGYLMINVKNILKLDQVCVDAIAVEYNLAYEWDI